MKRVAPLILLAVLLTGCAAASASTTAAVQGPATCTGGPVAGATPDQLANARAIAAVAVGLGLGQQGVLVGILTADVESDLYSLPVGDMTGPGGTMSTSRGLFQQLEAWGPLADRMDPTKSATMFYKGGHAGQMGLMSVPGWQQMDPNAAMQAVQQGGPPGGYPTKLAFATTLANAIGPLCKVAPTGGVAAGAFVSYTQWDPASAWASVPYWGSTIGNAGCGPASVAEVVATWKDHTVTPDKVAAHITSIGAEGQGDKFPGIFASYGLRDVTLTTMDQAVAGLRAGGIVIISGTGSSPFTSGGHFVVLRAIDPAGRIWLGDVNAPASERTNAHSWSVAELTAAMDGSGIHSLNLVTQDPPTVPAI